jgi:glutamate N-acetyltransferase/amino-acid N-acetyltransferase
MSKSIHVKGGVTAPKGFLASGIHSGIKKPPLLDLAMIVSEVEGPIAGMFTTNQIVAAPVILDRLNLKKKTGRAILINSGNANAFTGPQGLLDTREMAQLVSQNLQVPLHTIFVASTGVICPPLPMPAIRRGIPRLISGLKRDGKLAAQAIMTTDTTIKAIALRAGIGGKTVTIGGMAKGAGMIHPHMATMLAFLTTDAAIHQPTLQTALRKAVDQSFNCISVDGETSTNDTVLCLANGLANNRLLRSDSSELKDFEHLLNEVCLSLALQVCRDGEGATKMVEIQVIGAKNANDAKRFANTLVTSPLLKTALFGEDPNWGRILAAIGRAGPRLDPEKIGIRFDGIYIVKKGKGTGQEIEKKVKRVMEKREFTITVIVGDGNADWRIWTTDLSYDYVKINASYRS